MSLKPPSIPKNGIKISLILQKKRTQITSRQIDHRTIYSD